MEKKNRETDRQSGKSRSSAGSPEPRPAPSFLSFRGSVRAIDHGQRLKDSRRNEAVAFPKGSTGIDLKPFKVQRRSAGGMMSLGTPDRRRVPL